MFKNLLNWSSLSLKLEKDVYNWLWVYSLDCWFWLKFYVISDWVDFYDWAFYTSINSACDWLYSRTLFVHDENLKLALLDFWYDVKDNIWLEFYLNKKFPWKK